MSFEGFTKKRLVSYWEHKVKTSKERHQKATFKDYLDATRDLDYYDDEKIDWNDYSVKSGCAMHKVDFQRLFLSEHYTRRDYSELCSEFVTDRNKTNVWKRRLKREKNTYEREKKSKK
mmetsp:Transcript_10682/g.13291  ORF Transcript_10682/g.13291 Transcript_10682/m.13291 type:complete len:118 (+) Transcript_10682:1569-1922(+)